MPVATRTSVLVSGDVLAASYAQFRIYTCPDLVPEVRDFIPDTSTINTGDDPPLNRILTKKPNPNKNKLIDKVPTVLSCLCKVCVCKKVVLSEESCDFISLGDACLGKNAALSGVICAYIYIYIYLFI